LPVDDLVSRAVQEAATEEFEFPVVGSKVGT
jgi:hypothetical protein